MFTGFMDFIERRPSLGVIASLTGLGTSIVAWIQAASIIIGFVGAVFGLAAGYYTWRIKKRHWERLLTGADKE